MDLKPTLLLHIGTAKTGTTSIQEFLAFNRTELAKKHILYPSSLGDKNHIKIAGYAENAPWPFASKQFGINTPEKHQDFCLKLEQQLEQELAAHDYRHAIISNEHLHSNIKTKKQIQAVKGLLDMFFSDIKILMYFRRQDLMAVSRHSTALLVGHTPTQQLDMNAAKNYYYDFNAIYDNWAEVFGNDNVIARVFSRDRFISGNVITDFCAMSGLKGQEGLIMTERKNESLSLEAACLIHELNMRIKEGRITFAKPIQKKQLIEKITTRFKGPAHYPGRDLAQQFYQLCSASNADLEQRLGIKLFDDDFSMYPEQEDTALYKEKRLWAKTALDDFNLLAPTGITERDKKKSQITLNDIEFLVFSSHKTATQSIVHSLRTNNILAKHAHSIKHMDGVKSSEFFDGYYEHNNKPLKIITVFREPISRLISSFFQTYGDDHIRFLNKKRNETLIELLSTEELIEVFIDKLRKRKINGYSESVDYLIEYLSIDIKNLNFSEEKKIAVYRNEKYELYLVRFDILTSNFDDILSLITGINGIYKAKNKSEHKWYANKYKLFIDQLKLDNSLVDQVYQDKEKWIRIFYRDSAEKILQQTKYLYCKNQPNF